MIRCVRLWSGEDGLSHFEEGLIDLPTAQDGDAGSLSFPSIALSFHQTDQDPGLGWHTDPVRQLVITLAGTLKFTTQDGSFILAPGAILFTEDTTGAGHDWKFLADAPWRRLYAVLEKDTVVPFIRLKEAY